jgi:hypothetical protein
MGRGGEEFRGQEFRSTGVQEFRSSGVQEFSATELNLMQIEKAEDRSQNSDGGFCLLTSDSWLLTPATPAFCQQPAASFAGFSDSRDDFRQ